MLTTFPKSKFRPPELPAHYFDRERLLTLLRDDPGRRLICLAAGAGYGKSTLAAGLLRQGRLPFLWINLDAGDGDGAVFLQLVLRGLAHKFPSFEVALEREKILHQIHWPGRGRLLDAASDILEEQLAGRRLTVVLEDYHRVSNSDEVGDILDSLLRLLPPQVQFVLLSRNRVFLRAMPALTAAGRAAELSQGELRFTLEEAERFLAGQPGLALSRATAEQIWRELAGWPIGLQLAARALAAGAGTGDTTGLLWQGKGRLYLFEDIMKEIVDGEPPEIREVLLRTAVFQEWDGELFNDVFNRRDGAAIVAYLVGRGLPAERVPGGLRYHNLFREYLLNRLKEDVGGYREAERLAVNYYLAREKLEEAFSCLVAAGDFNRAGLILQRMAPAFLWQNRLNTLSTWLEALPGEVADSFPEIVLHFGEACVQAGKYREGLRWLRRAAGAFGRVGDAAGLTGALCVQGAAFTALGEHGNALAVYRQALGEVETGDPRLRGTVLHYLAVWAARTGEVERARRLFDEAADLYRVSGEATAEGEVLLDRVSLYCCRRGLFEEAVSLVGRVDVIAGTHGDHTLAARCQLLGGRVFLYLKKPVEALKRFELALQAVTEGESNSLTGVLARLGEAEAFSLLAVPDHERAELLFRRAADELGLLGPSLEASFLLALGQSTFFRHRGETSRAIEEAHNALELARGMSDGWQEAVAGLNLAAAWIEAGGESLSAGLKLLEETNAVFYARGDSYHLAMAGLWRFYGQFLLNGKPDPVLLSQCLKHLHRFSSLLSRERELGRFILEQARDAGTEMPRTADKNDTASQRQTRQPVVPVVADDGEHQNGSETKEDAELPPRLRICCLGAFQVYRGGELLDDRCWLRRKGKTLFKFLALHLGQKVPRDVVIDLLWPDLPAEKAYNAYYVTLHALRKTLSTGLRQEIEYIISRDGMVYLEPRLVEEVDVEAFSRASALAFSQEATAPDVTAIYLREARRLYRDDLLVEDAYENWPAPARERLRQQYLKILSALAAHSEGAGRPEEALELWQELVGRDPFHETGQREVLRLLLLQGQHMVARRQYLRYRRLLQKEMGTEPGKEITYLYLQSLKKN